MSGVVAWRVAHHPPGPFALRKTKPIGWACIEPLVLQSDLDAAIARAEAAEAERDELLVEVAGLSAEAEHYTAYTIVHRGLLRYCSSSMRDAYSDEHHRAERLAEAAERDATRYRGMRSVVLSERLDLVPPAPGEKTPDTFDAWIDAAIAAQQQEKRND